MSRRVDGGAAGPSTLPGSWPLRGKYRTHRNDKGMKSSPVGNNTRKSRMHSGLRWQTVRAAARRGTECVRCGAYDPKA